MVSIIDAICFKHHFVLVAFFLHLSGLKNILQYTWWLLQSVFFKDISCIYPTVQIQENLEENASRALFCEPAEL